MTRTWIGQHLPHALLLTGAAACLCFALDTPSVDHAPAVSAPDQEHVSEDTYTHRPYLNAEGNTRSLAEVLRESRVYLDRFQKDRKQVSDKPIDVKTPLATLVEEAPQRRVVRRRDVAALPKAGSPLAPSAVEYVGAADPLTWRAPESVGEHEYVVLGFGEVGQETVEVPATDIHTPTQESTPVITTDLVATPPVTDWMAEPTVSPSAMPIPGNTPTAPTPIASADTPAVSTLVTMQTASQSAPAPVAAHDSTVTPFSDADRTNSARNAELSSTTNTRPTATESATPKVSFAESTTLQDQPSADTTSDMTLQTTGAKDAWDDQTQNLSHRQTDKPAQIQPFTQNHTRQMLPKASQTPAATTAKHEDTKAEPTASFPTTGQEKVNGQTTRNPKSDYAPTVSAKPDSPATTKPKAKTTGQSTNSVVVYLDDHDKIGSDRVTAIDNALAKINQAAKKADIDVELKVTTNKNDRYNILFSEDDGKDMGNKLGLAEFAVTEDKHGNEYFFDENKNSHGGQAKVRINNSFNWFAGNEADDIQDDEYDYQTAIEHEFLHLLGLDDDFDHLDSVSHGLLSPGEVRRDIHDREINDLSSFYSAYNPWGLLNNHASSWSRSNTWGKTRYHAKALTAAVPEPTSLAMIGLGVTLGLAGRRR